MLILGLIVLFVTCSILAMALIHSWTAERPCTHTVHHVETLQDAVYELRRDDLWQAHIPGVPIHALGRTRDEAKWNLYDAITSCAQDRI